MALFLTLMSTRAAYLSPEHVRALNSIVVVFNKPGDTKVRDAWRRVLEHVETPAMTTQGTPVPGWFERYFDLKVDLFQAMAATIGYTFTADDLKRQVYSPISHGEAEEELQRIRKTLVKVLTEHGLNVRIVP